MSDELLRPLLGGVIFVYFAIRLFFLLREIKRSEDDGKMLYLIRLKLFVMSIVGMLFSLCVIFYKFLKEMGLQTRLKSNNFPNTEAFITDPSGQKLFIGADVRASGQDKSPTILFGPATEHIMNVNMNVKTDPKTGNFISVQKGKEWINIQDYNKQFLDKNPNP